MSASDPEPGAETKQCPFCAEDIKVAAIKCKHCQSSLLGDAEPSTNKPAQRFFNCLVCRRQYPEDEGVCPGCGAQMGQNFAMAAGQASPQASRGESSDPPTWMWWAIGLVMVGIMAGLIGVLASTKIGLIVGVVVIVLIVMAVN